MENKTDREKFIEAYKQAKACTEREMSEAIDRPIQVETPETKKVEASSEAFNEAVKGFEKTQKVSTIAMLAAYALMGIVFVASLVAVKKGKFKFAAIGNAVLSILNGATMGATIGYLIASYPKKKKEDRTYCEVNE